MGIAVQQEKRVAAQTPTAGLGEDASLADIIA
jgi:hypothetical protein